MKAVRVRAFGDIDGLKMDDIETPAPGTGEIAIDVAAAELNFPDILMIEGRY